MSVCAIIGMGTMGPGIAATLSRRGHAVRVHDRAEEAMARALAAIPLAKTVLDRLGTAAGPAGEGAITFATSLAEAVAGADLVIENVPERIEVKAELYRAIDPLVGPGTIIASDTSGIPISKLQAFVSHPGRMVGMHWSNPPHIIPMIEVIAGAGTSPETVAWMTGFINALGLLPVVVKKDVSGFVENRILYAVMREALDLVEQGVIDPEGLDTCVSWGIGYKLSVIGPMALLDMAGLDIYESVATFLNQDLSTRKDVAPMITAMTRDGRRGIKSGAGLYNYTPERIAELQAERARKLVAVRRALEAKQ